MGANTAIEWAHHTFNPWWGCEKVSPGCTNCYAETLDKRWGGKHWGASAERRFFSQKHWNEPIAWNAAAALERRRKRVFCASMADWAEDRKELDVWRAQIYSLIKRTPHLDWLMLSKRPENWDKLTPWGRHWPENVWPGVTAEDQARANVRIPILQQQHATVRFVSAEPLLEAIDLRNAAVHGCPHGASHDPETGAWECKRCEANREIDIDWVIVGGESGPGARPCQVTWLLDLVQQCRADKVPVFVKQAGSHSLIHADFRDAAGALIEERDARVKFKDAKGGDPEEWLEQLRVREVPAACGEKAKPLDKRIYVILDGVEHEVKGHFDLRLSAPERE